MILVLNNIKIDNRLSVLCEELRYRNYRYCGDHSNSKETLIVANRKDMTYCVYDNDAKVQADIYTSNSKLFFALIDMSNKDYGVVGEHWISINDNLYFPKGMIFKAKKEINRDRAFVDINGRDNGCSSNPLSMFRKATEREIIEYYMPSEKKPSKPKIYTGDLKNMPSKVLRFLEAMQLKYNNKIDLKVFDDNILTAKTNGGFNWSEEDNHSAVISDILLKNQHHLLKEDGTYTSEALARINKEPIEIKPYYGQIDLQEKKLSTFPENSTSPYIVRIKNKFVKNIPLYKEEPVIIKQVTIKIEKEDENFQVDLGF